MFFALSAACAKIVRIEVRKDMDLVGRSRLNLVHMISLSHGLVIQGTTMMDQKLVPSLDAHSWNQVQSQFLNSILYISLYIFIYSACYQDNSASSIASTSEYDDSNYIATDHLLPTTHQSPITHHQPPATPHPSSIHRHLNAIACEKVATGDLGNSLGNST